MPSVRVAAGPETAKAADQLRQLVERRDEMAFPLGHPAAQSIRRNPWGQIATPAIGVRAPFFRSPCPRATNSK